MNELPDFFTQLAEWSTVARSKLETGDLPAVTRALYLIRGTALIFGYFQIAYITGLGESVSYFAVEPENSRVIAKKCIDCLWDVLTTLEYMIANGIDNSTVEQKILLVRLEATLKSFRDFKPPLNQSEIDILVRSYESARDLARKNI